MVTRRFRHLAVILVLVLTGAALLPAQPTETGGFPLKAEMTGQLTGSLFRLYLTADPSVVWKPGVAALGIGTEFIVGLNQFDMYMLPYLRLELGWFHLDFGYALTLVQPPTGNEVGGLSAGFVFAPKPFEVAYGRFGFDLSLDFNLGAYRNAYRSYTGGSFAQQVLGAVLLSGRYGIGVSYSFSLF